MRSGVFRLADEHLQPVGCSGPEELKVCDFRSVAVRVTAEYNQAPVHDVEQAGQLVERRTAKAASVIRHRWGSEESTYVPAESEHVHVAYTEFTDCPSVSFHVCWTAIRRDG
jgi:hypothetical protein